MIQLQNLEIVLTFNSVHTVNLLFGLLFFLSVLTFSYFFPFSTWSVFHLCQMINLFFCFTLFLISSTSFGGWEERHFSPQELFSTLGSDLFSEDSTNLGLPNKTWLILKPEPMLKLLEQGSIVAQYLLSQFLYFVLVCARVPVFFFVVVVVLVLGIEPRLFYH